MLSGVMVDAGLDPTVIVGSVVEKFGSNFRKGNRDPRQGGTSYLVVEADEYNRHFLNFHPFVSVVTNIEADHLDCYRDLGDVKDAFGKFLSQSENKIVDYYSKYLAKVPKLSVPGEHNRANAAAAFAVADFLNIDAETIKKSLAEFAGIWRRLERRGVSDQGTIIYDDYAHHPTEIKASLQALRELYPSSEKNIVVVFQPHLYSRTKALFDDFAKSFTGADKVLLLPIYFAREDKDDTISSEKLASALVKNGVKTEAFTDFPSAEQAVLALGLGPNDVLVTMGAGEAYKIADSVFKLG
jgi:UDP-N-acetylmuramate--alanine ligase